MSTKAMGRMYTRNGGPRFPGGGGGFDNPSWLSSLFGQDAVTGGKEYDPEFGIDVDVPYQGSGGIFGGQSRRLATMLNAQRNDLLTRMQGDKDFAKLQSQLAQAEEANKTLQALALKHGVHPSVIADIASPLNKQMSANALTEERLRGGSLANPDAQSASNVGTFNRLASTDPNAITAAPFGGIATRQSPTGGFITASGGTQSQDVFIDQFGMAHTRQQNFPGNVSTPVDAFQYDQAKNLPRPNPNFTAGPSLGTGVSAMPGLTSPSRGMTLGGQQSTVGNNDPGSEMGNSTPTTGTSSSSVSPVPAAKQPPAGVGAITSPGGQQSLMGMLGQIFSRGATANNIPGPTINNPGGNALASMFSGGSGSPAPSISPNPGVNPAMMGNAFVGQQPSAGGMQGMSIPGGVSGPSTGVSAMPSMNPMPYGPQPMSGGVPYTPEANATGQNMSPTMLNYLLMMQQMEKDRMSGFVPQAQ